jgi:hypothetical protein
MSTAIAFIRWHSYSGGPADAGFFASDPLTYNSSQERLHSLSSGDHLWLVSRSPDDQQYYFVGMLVVSALRSNPSGTPLEQEFGRFSIIADPSKSHDLSNRFRADGLLRAFQFESDKPIKFGASLGQSVQTIRLLSPSDEQILEAALERVLRGEGAFLDAPFGLWTKCDSIFAEYFLKNWQARREPLAFLLYDSLPVLTPGAPVFIHSDKNLRLLASFRESQFVAGHKHTVDTEERLAERERVWSAYRAQTLDPPSKRDFDSFWERQNGVRALFVMDNVSPISEACPFKTYGRALEWGYPMGVGYRYLSLSQCALLLHHVGVASQVVQEYLNPLLRAG